MKIIIIFNNKFVICIEYVGIIELKLTFILSNQFLVWIAIKIFVYYDLNLVLTKYYKKIGSPTEK